MNLTPNPITEYLRSTKAIRERCNQLFLLATNDQLLHLKVNLDRIDDTVDYVLEVIKRNYPDLNIPYHSRWRHFCYGEIDLWKNFLTSHTELSKKEIGRIQYEIAITSVLLDAGSGKDWCYHDKKNGIHLRRSEGLAVASFDAFMKGSYSSAKSNLLQADQEGLASITVDEMRDAFQVSDKNPLLGVDGRVQLINKLADCLKQQPQIFHLNNVSRLGHLFDYFLSQAIDNKISALSLLEGVLNYFSEIWPNRLNIDGENLGDVWTHPLINGLNINDHFIPFHKLSQWLTYSLIEPLEHYGVVVTEIDRLTGLAEYRNGGLFIDKEVIQAKNNSVLGKSFSPEDEIIIEWRALTICLLDLIAEKIAQKLQKDSHEFPLAKVLQGGTWLAGREIAQKLRHDGAPPINIISDGTVF